MVDGHVDRHNVLPVVGNSGARDLSLHLRFAVVGRGFGRDIKAVLQNTYAIPVWLEELLHLVISVEVHVAGHVLFDDGFEVSGESSLVIEGLAIVLDHVFGELIGIAGVHELQAEHVENLAIF